MERIPALGNHCSQLVVLEDAGLQLCKLVLSF
jgi:hypothetical protein